MVKGVLSIDNISNIYRKDTEKEIQITLLADKVKVKLPKEEINIPKEKKWYDCITPHLREMKLKKPVSFREYQTNIRQNFVLPEPELSQIDSIRLKEYYVSETESIDLCPKCRKDFERFMRNE